MRTRSWLAALALSALAVPHAAEAQVSVFPRRAELTVPSTGVVRVELSAEIVQGSGPALGDLRILDNDGRALPYAIDGAPPAGARVTTLGPLTPVEARQQMEGAEGATPIYREVYDLDLPPEQPTSAWTLALMTASTHFTAEATVERLVPGATPEPLTARSVFRLASGAERLDMTLPPHASGRIRVTLTGESGFLSPVFELRSIEPPATPTFLTLPLTVEREEHRGGKTILDARRPMALVPNALVLHPSQTTVRRYVRVYDTGPDGTQAIVGQGEVSRVTEPGAAPEPLVLALDPGRGDRLRIEIDDGDSGPLPELRADLRIHQPTVIFDPTTAYRPVRIYFGGRRVLPPTYPESEALLAAARGDAPAGVGTVGRIEPNPSYSRAPALAFAMAPGPVVEAGAFEHQADLTIVETPEGLARIVLPSAVEARMDPAREDVRVVAADGRQWPYLRGLDVEREPVSLAARRESPRPGTSRYVITLPEAPLAIEALLLDVPAEYVDRAYRLLHRAEDGEEVTWGEGRLQRRPGDAGPLRVAVGQPRVEALVLEVTDGNDAPLAPRIAAVVTHRVLFAAAPPGEYRLLFGIPEHVEAVDGAEWPSYEIERARDLVFALPYGDARVGEVEANPDFDPPSPYSGSKLRDLVLWLVLGFAVVVLGALTFRLSRLAPPPSDGPTDA